MNVYRKAIEAIKERGRGRVELVCDDKTVCLIGAMAIAKGATDEYLLDEANEGYALVRHEAPLIAKVIEEQFPDRCRPIQPTLFKLWTFNDDLRTTDTDVILVLEKAAIQWDELNGN